MSLERGTIYEVGDMTFEGELSQVQKTVDTPMFYFVYNMANYYHFIYDTLPYLFSYFNEKMIHPDMKLLVSPPEGQDDLYPFVWDSLSMLGITRDDVVFLDPEVSMPSQRRWCFAVQNPILVDPANSAPSGVEIGRYTVGSPHSNIFRKKKV